MRNRPGSLTAVVLRVIAVLALAAVCVLVAVSLLARDRRAESQAVGDASTFTPPAVSQPATALISVVGDGLSGEVPGSAAEAEAPTPWIAIVPRRLSVRLSPFVEPGSGWVVEGQGTSGSTFVQRAALVSSSSRVTVFFGGAADVNEAPADVQTAAARAIATVERAAPNGRVVIVGPAWPTSSPPADLLAVRDRLRAAATAADVTWVDPISRRWLQGTGLWASTGLPTEAGQRALGTLMTRVVSTELDR